MIRAIKSNELPAVIELLDATFFDGDLFFAQRFPLLFSEGNLENVFAFFHDGEIAGTASVYTGSIITGNRVIPVASLGAVATRSTMRGRGIASRLLEFTGTQLVERGIAMVFISGLGKIYTDWGAVQGGALKEVIMLPPDSPQDEVRLGLEKVQTVDDAVIKHVHASYQTKPVRFQRTLDETRSYLEGNLFCPKLEDNTLWLVKNDGETQGYVFTRESMEGTIRLLRIVEYAGVGRYLPRIARMLFSIRKIQKLLYHLEEIDFSVDDARFLGAGDTIETIPITGTIKVLDGGFFLNGETSGLYNEYLPRLSNAFPLILPAVNTLGFV
jgi:GNAT superfamily N-acetyltransferase